MIERHAPTLKLAGLLGLLIVIVAVLSSVWPTQEEYFFELGLLGNNKAADKYFTNADSTVDVGATNNWFIYVHNHMGNTQNVLLRAKLVNSTAGLPSDRNHQPSLAASFAEFPVVLSANETALIPFSWSVLESETCDDTIVLRSLLVNGERVEAEVLTSPSSSLYMIFELWTQDRISEEYRFGWKSGDGFSSASVYMGFKFRSTTN